MTPTSCVFVSKQVGGGEEQGWFPNPNPNEGLEIMDPGKVSHFIGFIEGKGACVNAWKICKEPGKMSCRRDSLS